MTNICYTMPRSFGGYCIPISFQSIAIRNYCSATGIRFSLPITEMCLPQSFPVFSKIINDPTVSSIVVCSFSVFSDLLDVSIPLPLRSEPLTIFSALERSQCQYNQLYQRMQTVSTTQLMQQQIAKQLLASHESLPER